MSSRTALVVTTVALAVALAVAVALLIPWRPLPLHGVSPSPVDAARDFSAAQIAREDAFHAAVRPPAYVSMLVAFLIAAVLGFTPLGARLVSAVAAPLGGGWVWRVVLGTVALTLVGRLLTLPWDAWSESARRRYGLSTRGWGSWGVDVAKAYGVGLVLTVGILLLIVGLARWQPDYWWVFGAAIGALLVVVVSFAYPLVVEPVFNKFTSMPEGELRTSLLELAEQDGVQVDDVLIADASKRTTTLNAYVSGIGSSRRIVVYDTLLDKAPDAEVESVVAHELGHVADSDVVVGTALGALGAMTVVVALYLLSTWSGLMQWLGISGIGDGRSVAFLLAFVALVGFVSTPLQSAASREVEARADVHALDLTGDPATFLAMQRRLAVTAKADVTPNAVVYRVFGSHPKTTARLAAARAWAEEHGVSLSGPVVPVEEGE